ncbi:NAD(P)/FAD-dependent oxidoreductase [Lampropedia puyangensis]|uniref:NAD(P)/FAD-dependent oxidoreductase n=1 Tax=Lampropedia puyangensis TaxID=1330072 RepID=A0A4V4GRZ3_9BURK|nr:NAD(P)/FAD-dependent oxidoreductase [Lampropedia puyangensis]THU02586.1 NAD(P)/FAD-dependent oxidoreductase [Lampropedia puyangensis]
MRVERTQILIIGAGPSGAVAAGMLRQRGYDVMIVEKQTFPRFSIGESLLPQCMTFIEEAGMLQAVVQEGFQFKNGAAFARGNHYTEFDFREKFTSGWGTTYQVQRARFDHVLALEAQKQGADLRFEHEVLAVDFADERPRIQITSSDTQEYTVECDFVLDASGYGRVLARLLNLEYPSNFPVRGALFTHITDQIQLANPLFDRQKIRISVHPQHQDVWYWTIPFSNGRCSQGVVASADFLKCIEGNETQQLRTLVQQEPGLSHLLEHAVWDTPARSIIGYSANVKSLHGKGFALLGNAGEFLDPVFSSGVTIALKSAHLASQCLDRHLKGSTVDWESDYAMPLKRGVDTFRVFVEGWYSGQFQDVVFHPNPSPQIKSMISSILAGYAWDIKNPYVEQPQRRLTTLAQVSRQGTTH